MLRAKGAVVIDADALGHEVLAPGGAAYQRVIDRFGREIVRADRTIDREKLGRVVFEDPEARRDLNAITHPEIYELIRSRLDELRGSGGLVVLDAALLVETLPDRGASIGLDALVVVAASPHDQIDRLAEGRGMSRPEVEARIEAQAPPSLKLAAADYIVDNRGSSEDLSKTVDVLFDDLVARFGRGAG